MRLQNQMLCDLHFADMALMESSDFMQQLRSFKPQSLGCAVARRKSSTTLIFPLPPQACSGTTCPGLFLCERRGPIEFVRNWCKDVLHVREVWGGLVCQLNPESGRSIFLREKIKSAKSKLLSKNVVKMQKSLDINTFVQLLSHVDLHNGMTFR